MKKTILSILAQFSISLGAVSQTLVHDINPGTANSNIQEIATFGNDLYYSAYDFTNGAELWKYDGNTSSLVADTSTTTFAYYPEQLTVVGNYLYFVAHDGIHGWEIWKTDGTNTTMLPEVRPGNNNQKPTHLFAFNNELYFQASDATNGSELWRTDGTTNTMIDINPGAGNASPQEFVVFNNALYFTANDGTHGIELWKYDGINATLVWDIITGNASSNPYELTVFGNELFFGANDSILGGELWSYDGTNVTLIQDINTGATNSHPDYLTVIGNNLYFAAYDNNGNKLMKYNGNTIVEIPIGTSSNPYPDQLTAINSELYFRADDGVHGVELWKYDGNIASLVHDILPGIAFGDIDEITKFGNLVYFIEFEYEQLWNYNGTTANVVPIDTTMYSSPEHLTVLGNNLYFSAYTAEFGQELWKIEGSNVSTVEFNPFININIFPNPTTYQLTIQTEDKLISAKIIDATGRSIDVNLRNENTIDVSNLSNGVYLLQIKTDKGIVTKKFINE